MTNENNELNLSALILSSQFRQEQKNREQIELEKELDVLKSQISEIVKKFSQENRVEIFNFKLYYLKKYQKIKNLKTELAYLNYILNQAQSPTEEQEKEFRSNAKEEVQEQEDEKYRKSRNIEIDKDKLSELKNKYRSLATLIHPDKYEIENWKCFKVTRQDLTSWFNQVNEAKQLINTKGDLQTLEQIFNNLDLPDNLSKLPVKEKNKLKERIRDYFRVDPENLSISQKVKVLETKIIELRNQIVINQQLLHTLTQLYDSNITSLLARERANLELEIEALKLQIADIKAQILEKTVNEQNNSGNISSLTTVDVTSRDIVHLEIPETQAELNKRLSGVFRQIEAWEEVSSRKLFNTKKILEKGNYIQEQRSSFMLTENRTGSKELGIEPGNVYEFDATDMVGRKQSLAIFMKDSGSILFMDTHYIDNEYNPIQKRDLTEIYLYVKDFIQKYISRDLFF
ncbi:MAG: hypothetical protein AAGF07_05025 [Patescibacteria group bacterium]